MLKQISPTLKVILFLSVMTAVGHGRLLRLEIKERSPVLDGRSFGAAGSYERIVARAYFAIDPKDPVNQTIVDIANAPRNKDGMVAVYAQADRSTEEQRSRDV